MKNLIVNNSFKLIFGIILFLISCIEDNITPPLTGDLNPVAEMLVYFESNGDFPNSYLAPALIDAEEVFANLTSFLILDIRTQAEYSSGHIEHAINVSADSLYNLVEANFYSGYPKIVIVSKNGQSSAYFTCLLRLVGFNNVYTMNFGMASWNEVFAVEWLSELGDYSGINNFTDNTFNKNDYTAFPQISFANPNEQIEERVKSRINQIISLGFNQGEEYFPTLPNLLDKYPICYGKTNLYNARKFGVFDEMGHPVDTRSYLDYPLYEFRSVKYLQTLPTTQQILLYDYDGQFGACMTAYLRVLGYDVKVLLFGANQLFYSRLLDDPELINYAFSSDKIQSFPFVTGE
jgi:rhodanese-related sulfurtransferase